MKLKYPDCLDLSLTMSDDEWRKHGLKCKENCKYRRLHKPFIRNANIPFRLTYSKHERKTESEPKETILKPHRRTFHNCIICNTQYYLDTDYDLCNSPARDLCDECIINIKGEYLPFKEPRYENED